GAQMDQAAQRIQLELIKNGFNEECADGDTIEIGASVCGEGGAEFLYVQNRLLVREEFVPAVRDVLGRLFLFPLRPPHDGPDDGPDQKEGSGPEPEASPGPPRGPDAYWEPVVAGL